MKDIEKKICFINPGINIRRPISSIMPILRDDGYDVSILTPRNKNDPNRRKTRHYDDFKGINLQTYPVVTRSSGFVWPIPISLSFIKKTWNLLKNNSIIHVWVPFYPNTFMVCLIKILFFKRKKLILTMDTFPGYSFKASPLLDPLFKIFFRTIARISYAAANIITTYCSSIAKYSKNAGIPKSKLKITPTGINLTIKNSKKDIRKELGLTPNDKIALFVGLHNKRKGIDTILKIAYYLKDVNLQFLLIGDGPLRKRAMKVSNTLGLNSKVHFLGKKFNLEDYYNQADLFLFPSRGEGLAGVLMEAMKYGVPIITSDIEGTKDLITNMENGLLCRMADYEEYAKNIKKVLEDTKLIESFKKAGKEKISREYSWQNNIKQFKLLYKMPKLEAPKKILIATPTPYAFNSGVSSYVRGLIVNLLNKQYTIHYLCTDMLDQGCGVIKYSKKFREIRKKSYLLTTENNVLHFSNPISNYLTFLIKNGKKYDLIHVHSYIYFVIIQVFLYKLIFNRKLPIILHLHGGIQTKDYESTNLIEKVLLFIKRSFFDLLIGKIMMKTSEALISVSKSDLLAINEVFRVNRKRKNHNYYVPNVINISKFHKMQNKKREYIGFIGRLTKIKGIDFFIQFIKKYYLINPKQKYLIIGKGAYMDEVNELTKKYPILFIKEVKPIEMIDYYNICEIFVQTSRSEGLPTCVLEALACEVPVVVSNVGGTKEIVINGYNGFKYEPGKIEDIIKLVEKIKKDDLFREMGRNGRKLVEETYTWNKSIKEINQIYKKIYREAKYS